MGEEPSANRYRAAIPSLRKVLQYLDASGSGAQPNLSREPSSSTSPPSASRVSPTFPDVVREPQVLNDQVTLVKDGYLGDGGFGYVCAANFRSGDGSTLKVAVKLPKGQTAKCTRSIAREIKLLNGLDHRNILQLHGICTELEGCEEIVSEETPALVMSLCVDINSYIFQNPWSKTRVPLMLDVIRGLAYLHSFDIVHGDVKPANILVKLDEDNNPIGVLADFGHSHVESQSGYTTQFTSTPLFTAPELYPAPADNFRDDTFQSTTSISGPGPTATKPSDIYSFALTLLTIVSGRMPFESLRAPPGVNFLLSPYNKRPKRSDHMSVEMSDEIWRIQEDCWSSNPGQRLEVAAVLDRLEACSQMSESPLDLLTLLGRRRGSRSNFAASAFSKGLVRLA